MPRRFRLPKQVVKALEEASLPYTLVSGKRHMKIMVNGHLVGIIEHAPNDNVSGRSLANLTSQIRRLGRGAPPSRRNREGM
jgi:hypothetical protein